MQHTLFAIYRAAPRITPHPLESIHPPPPSSSSVSSSPSPSPTMTPSGGPSGRDANGWSGYVQPCDAGGTRSGRSSVRSGLWWRGGAGGQASHRQRGMRAHALLPARPDVEEELEVLPLAEVVGIHVELSRPSRGVSHHLRPTRQPSSTHHLLLLGLFRKVLVVVRLDRGLAARDQVDVPGQQDRDRQSCVTRPPV